jgi:hypothetical protein
MSDNHTAMQHYKQKALTTPSANDGWADAAVEAAERMIRGTLLKFADWRWSAGKEASPVKDGTKLVAVGTLALWQRWENGKPVEIIVRQPGKRLPDRDELGHLDESQWEKGPDGEPKDPWHNTRLVYLVDPRTAEPSRSAPAHGAAAAPLPTSATRSRACARSIPTPCPSSNCARRKCRPSSGVSRSRYSRSSAGKRPTPENRRRPSASSRLLKLRKQSAIARWTTKYLLTE